MQDTMLLVDLSLELFGAVILVAVLFGTFRLSSQAAYWHHYFQYLIVTTTIFMAANGWLDLLNLNQYQPGEFPYSCASAIVTISYHLTFTFFVAFLTAYIQQYCEDVSRIPLIIANIVFVLAVFLRIGGLTGLLPPSDLWFFLGRSCGHTIVVLTFYLMIRYRKKFKTSREWVILSIVPILPILSALLGLFNFPSYLLPQCGVISIVFVSNFLHNNQEIRMQAQEDELSRQKVQLMVSQIQPHFTFNVLNSIYVLCETDPKMAQEVIDNFSQYLRHHIDTLSSLDMIPFSRELELVQNYVYLEKVRFGEDLKVNYDLQCQSFEIPPLTIQPLVENAIKHGVMKRPEGGTVTLRTEESSDHYIITVEDNGVGFSTKDNESRMTSPTRDHRSVGLRNVRYRLRAICQGDLTVESTPGVGTNVQILLPKS